MSKSEFRATSPDEQAAVSEFLQRIFGMNAGHPVVEPHHLRWKCWEERADWPGSRGYVMASPSGIAAHATVVPLSARCGERKFTMAHPIDWAAESKAVGSGVTLLKRIGQLVDGVLIAGGSDMTQKILPALGFKVCGHATRFARPLRPLRRLAGHRLDGRRYAQAARALFWKWKAPSGPLPGWEARRVAPEGLDSLDIPWPRPMGEAMFFERSAETMKYFLRCHAAPMRFYVASKEGIVRGYFLLAFAPAQVRIADLWVDSTDRGDWRALVGLAVREAARDPDAAEVVSMASDPVASQAFLDRGFHSRGSVPLRLLASGGAEIPDVPVTFRMLDSDAAYLHNGAPDFWA